MKRSILALTVFTALTAVSGQAFAVRVYHCMAHPDDLEDDKHFAVGHSIQEALDKVKFACEAEHHVPCTVDECSKDHD